MNNTDAPTTAPTAPSRLSQRLPVFLYAGELSALGGNSAHLPAHETMRQPQNMTYLASLTLNDQFHKSVHYPSLVSPQTLTNSLDPTDAISIFGAEVTLAWSLLQVIEDDMALLKYTYPNSTLSRDWTGEGDALHGLRTFVSDSFQELETAGFAPELQAIFWQQGESECVVDPASTTSYSTRLSSAIYALRSLDVASQADLPFIIAPFHPSQTALDDACVQSITSQQQQYALADEHTLVVGDLSLDTVQPAHLYLDAMSYELLGDAMGSLYACRYAESHSLATIDAAFQELCAQPPLSPQTGGMMVVSLLVGLLLTLACVVAACLAGGRCKRLRNTSVCDCCGGQGDGIKRRRLSQELDHLDWDDDELVMEDNDVLMLGVDLDESELAALRADSFSSDLPELEEVELDGMSSNRFLI